ncbi:transcription elongation factor GreA [Candidatus Saccharibacteria bacterium]|nr:transcription elongation factor GreA [Candidatus Saccharibacteria bacterium]MBQ1540303.1 transcription elongation factor GreA [Candidatus Saccharibacteria bacterium]
MIKKSISLTAEGKKDLEKELDELIKNRPAIAERIATARAFGDLSENEEYSSARNEQKIAEGRILEIQDILKNAKIIRGGKKNAVALGATVVLDMGGREVTYTLVGATEANPLEGKISDASPIGKAVLGHKAGEEIDFNDKKVKIVEIK